MARDPYKYFRVEARELLDQLSRTALDLEKGPAPELVAKLLRLAHTLKGAARVVRRSDIGDRAHAIEDALAPLRDSTQQATRKQVDAILRYLDEINGCVAALSSPALSPDEPAGARTSAEDVPRTVRVDISEMDALLDGLTEMHAQLRTLQGSLKQYESSRRLMELLGTQLASPSDHKIDSRRDQTGRTRAQAVAEQVAASLDGLNRAFASRLELLDREFKQVRDAAERVRLIPADNLFIALERVARDAAQVQNKQVVFEGRGGEVRLDAQVLGKVQAALSHAVRNAVVHGVETRSTREAAGKPPAGRVTIDVSQRGRRIVFACSDDGSGIALDAIRHIAAQRGVSTDRAQSTDALLRLLLKGGISTMGKVTEVAGRGVGLDVVRDTAEQIDGKVELHTEAGKGTTLTLTVPLSIASLDGLLVESAGIVAIIPIESVRGTLRIEPGQIARNAQRESLIFETRAVPFLPLASALFPKTRSSGGNRDNSAVIVEVHGAAVAIGVDRLLGSANVVLRPLPALTPASAVVAGVSLDMEGNPQLVLDPASLISEAQHASAPPSDDEAPRPAILVIDDSLTTRMLERSILESAGYEVDIAVSGEEAIEKAARNRYALFLVDVEMPGMDGFTFIEKTRADPKLRDTPAILVTSRASPEDLQRGREVGARGHIVKSEFDQGVLLARIGELVN